MSVRRLAEPAVQPAAFAFNGAMAVEARKWIAKYPEGRQQSAVIPLLMLAQEQEGWVTKAAIESIADMLDMPYIRALEVATFYTQFQLKPVGTRAHVQVCGTTPCMLRGAEELMDVCRSKIHPEPFHTNAAGTLSWEEVECLGACVNAPMVMIFKDTFEDLTPDRLGEIIDAFEAGQGSTVPVGPQNDRIVSAPQSGLTSLTDEAAIFTKGPPPSAARKPTDGKRGATVPPSQTAKPSTFAAETNAAMNTPSPEKVPLKSEMARSVPETPHDAVQANKVEPAVEAETKQRKAKGKDTGAPAAKSPELLKGGPLGPTGKRRRSEAVAPEGEPSPDGKLAGQAAKPPRGRSRKPANDDNRS